MADRTLGKLAQVKVSAELRIHDRDRFRWYAREENHLGACKAVPLALVTVDTDKITFHLQLYTRMECASTLSPRNETSPK